MTEHVKWVILCSWPKFRCFNVRFSMGRNLSATSRKIRCFKMPRHANPVTHVWRHWLHVVAVGALSNTIGTSTDIFVAQRLV